MSRTAPTLAQIDAEAARWVARRDAGLTPVEDAEFKRWRAENALHVEAVERFEATWSALARPRHTGAAPVLQSELGDMLRRRRRRRALIAAAACAAALLAGALWRTPPPAATPAVAIAATPRTTILAPERQTLPDGSVIEHRPGAEVRVDFSGAARRVELVRGEALFEVAKDATRPFVVRAGGVEVRAVGTAFSVQLGASQVEVLVTEGRVAIDRPAAGPATPAVPPLAFVDAGNRLTVEVALQPVALPAIEPVKPADVTERLAWRTPRVEFFNAPLSEVVTVLNRYNETKFTLADPALAAVPLSGLFRADDAEVFTNLLRAGFGIVAEPRDGRIVLRRGP